MRPSLHSILSLLAVSGVLAPLTQSQEPPQSRRAKVLEIAERYKTHRWVASERHVFHGVDPKGVRVDTPDSGYRKGGFKTDGSQNVGIPYQWGGFSSIEEFDAGLKTGAYAGHLPRRGSSGASKRAVGVDCSGFVSRCWSLPSKQSTRSLGRICFRLASPADLLPGDVMNAFDKHVVMFKSFVGDNKKKARIIEAASGGVAERIADLEKLTKAGFIPMRYQLLDPRWVDTDFGEASFRADHGEKGGTWIADKDTERSFEDLPDVLTDTLKSEWVRYSQQRDEVGNPSAPKRESRTTSRAAAQVSAASIDIQETTWIDGKKMAVLSPSPRSMDWKQGLIDFPGFEQKFDAVQMTESQVEAGHRELGGQVFDAFRVNAKFSAKLRIRSVRYPVKLTVVADISKQVPLHGVLQAVYTVQVTFGKDANGDPRVSTMKVQFKLLDFARPGSLEEFQTWAKESAVKLPSLARDKVGSAPFTFLDKALKQKRIVFLGESDHFVGERMEFRLLLIRELMQRGYRRIGMEMGYSDGLRMDRYLATGDESWLDRVALYGYREDLRKDRKDEIAGWTDRSHSEFSQTVQDEALWFLRQLRKINEELPEGEPRLSWFGYDLSFRPGGGYSDARELLAKHPDKALARDIERRMKRVPGETRIQEADRLEKLVAVLDERQTGLLEFMSKEDSLDLRRSFQRMADAFRFIEDMQDVSNLQPNNIVKTLSRRERRMDHNFDEHLAEWPEDEKLILLGHALHLSKDSEAIHTESFGMMWKSIGTYLTQKVPGEVYGIWLLHHRGQHGRPRGTPSVIVFRSPRRALEGHLAALHPILMLPLGSNDPGEAWLHKERVFSNSGSPARAIISRQADCLFFVEQAHAPGTRVGADSK